MPTPTIARIFRTSARRSSRSPSSASSPRRRPRSWLESSARPVRARVSRSIVSWRPSRTSPPPPPGRPRRRISPAWWRYRSTRRAFPATPPRRSRRPLSPRWNANATASVTPRSPTKPPMPAPIRSAPPRPPPSGTTKSANVWKPSARRATKSKPSARGSPKRSSTTPRDRRVAVFIRANRASIETRLRRFDLAEGDPAANYRDLVRDLDSAGAVSRVGVVLRSIWAYRSQARWLAAAVDRFGAGVRRRANARRPGRRLAARPERGFRPGRGLADGARRSAANGAPKS